MAIDPEFRLPEDESLSEGSVIFSVDPLVLRDRFELTFLHSLAQDSPFFISLAEGVLTGSTNPVTGFTFATPRAWDPSHGQPTHPQELPPVGRVHSWTTCFKVGQSFRRDAPFHLALIEFDGVETLFLGRVYGCDPEDFYIGMPVRAKFRRLSRFNVTDVYFVPTEEAVRPEAD